MIKKIFIILIIANSLIAIWLFRGFLSESLRSSEKTVVIKSEPSEEKIAEKEEIIEKSLEVALAEGEIKTALITEQNKIIYYNQNNFLETDTEGVHKVNLGAFPFGEVWWSRCSRSGKYCLIQNKEGFSVYNLDLKKNTSLSSEIKSVQFNSQEDGLIYLFYKNGKYELNSSSLVGDNWIRVGSLSGENMAVSIGPRDSHFVYFSRDTSEEKSGIFLGNLGNQEFDKKISDKDIIDVIWSPTGSRILFSFFDHSVSPKRVQLAYYDLIQEKEYLLGFPTIAQKCTWSDDSNSLYCAVLTSSSPKRFSLPDWQSRKFVSRDIFWKIDLKENKKEKLFLKYDQYDRVDAFNLILEDGELIFIDKISGNLFKREI